MMQQPGIAQAAGCGQRRQPDAMKAMGGEQPLGLVEQQSAGFLATLPAPGGAGARELGLG